MSTAESKAPGNGAGASILSLYCNTLHSVFPKWSRYKGVCQWCVSGDSNARPGSCYWLYVTFHRNLLVFYFNPSECIIIPYPPVIKDSRMVKMIFNIGGPSLIYSNSNLSFIPQSRKSDCEKKEENISCQKVLSGVVENWCWIFVAAFVSLKKLW